MTPPFVSTGVSKTHAACRKSALRVGTGGIEKVNQLREAARPQVAELPPVAFLDGFIQPGEDTQSLRRDLRRDDPPVRTRAGSNDQTAPLEPVQQAGDVRIVSEHALPRLVAAEALGSGAAQNAQDVVLSAGKAERLDHLFGAARQSVRRAQEAEIRIVFEGARGLAWLFGPGGR